MMTGGRAVRLACALACTLLACAVLVGVVTGAGVAGSAVAQPAPVAVLGYQEESDSPSLIGRDARALSGPGGGVGVDGTTLTASGHGVQATDPQALAQLAAARRAGLPASLLVSNWSDAINDFSEPLAHRLLDDPAAIQSVAAALSRTVERQRWQGITLDFESLSQRDETGLTALARAVRAALPAGATLMIDVMNWTSAGAYAGTGYDLRALGRIVDRVVLMAYDEDGPWENTPGPVGALSWQTAGLRIVLRYVPASRVLLGAAGYGYAWGPHANVQLSDAGARAVVRRAGARAHWVARIGEWTATLRDGTVVWWADARSIALRIGIARRYGLAGVAVWDLGLSDPLSALR